MVLWRMVDLSILRGWPCPCSMVHSSLMSTLNWSRRFFSDLLRDALHKKNPKKHASVSHEPLSLFESGIHTVSLWQATHRLKPRRLCTVPNIRCKYESLPRSQGGDSTATAVWNNCDNRCALSLGETKTFRIIIKCKHEVNLNQTKSL